MTIGGENPWVKSPFETCPDDRQAEGAAGGMESPMPETPASTSASEVQAAAAHG